MEERKQAWTTEFETYSVGALVTTDGSGDPTLGDNVGFASVSKTATGTYKFVLSDKWKRLIAANPSVKITASNIDCKIAAHDVDATSPYITVLTHTGLGAAAATATNTAMKFCGHVSYLNPIAAELITIAADALMVDSTAHTLTGVQPDFPRPLALRVTDADTSITAGLITVVGTSYDGSAITEDIDIGGGGTATYNTTLSYATVTSVTPGVLTGEGAGDNLSVGVAAGLGLPIPDGATGVAVSNTIVDGVVEAVAGLDTTGNFIEPTTAANGTHDYDFYYQYTVTPVQSAHTHTASGAAADVISGEIQLFAMLRRR